MATQIKSVSQANKQFSKNLNDGANHVEKSHVPFIWALLNAIESQDASQLDAMRVVVADTWPTLVSRFTDYVLASVDGLKVVAGAFEDDGGTFTLSDTAVLATPWNTKERLAKDNTTPKAVDPRSGIKQLANKCAKRGLVDGFKSHAPSKAQKQVAEVMARALADLEAIHAGTYGKVEKAVDEVSTARAKRKAA